MTSSPALLLENKYSSATLARASELLSSLIPRCGMPLYHSIDIRDSGERIVAVDVNLFPAGFNNLSPDSLVRAGESFRSFFKERLGTRTPWKIGLVPEAHTNNEAYLRNLLALKQSLEAADAEVRLAWSGMPIPKPWELKVHGTILTYFPAKDVTEWSEALVLNHDLSGGILEALKDYPKAIYPSPELGWHKRKKSEHFDIARELLEYLSERVDIDPDDFFAKTQTVGDLDFTSENDVQRLQEEASKFFDHLGASGPSPFVYVKNDSGTYGLGVWSFSSLDQLQGATKLLQKRFQRGKQGALVRQIILQEGIRTRFVFTETDPIEVEPVIYSVNGGRVGTFLRCGYSGKGERRGGELNLNRPDSWFEDESRFSAQLEPVQPLYCFVTKLHAIAAAIEDCPCDSKVK